METEAWGLWTLYVYTLHQACARSQEKSGDESDACQHRCKGNKVGEVGEGGGKGLRGMEGRIEEGGEERKGTGKTGVEGLSL